MYIVNKRGPTIDPWETPQKSGAQKEEASPRPIQGHITDATIVLQVPDLGIIVHYVKCWTGGVQAYVGCKQQVIGDFDQSSLRTV